MMKANYGLDDKNECRGSPSSVDLHGSGIPLIFKNHHVVPSGYLESSPVENGRRRSSTIENAPVPMCPKRAHEENLAVERPL